LININESIKFSFKDFKHKLGILRNRCPHFKLFYDWDFFWNQDFINTLNKLNLTIEVGAQKIVDLFSKIEVDGLSNFLNMNLNKIK
jgi:hypothetical protein